MYQSTPVTVDILHKLAMGDKLSDPELVGVYAHFAGLEQLLRPLGPVWAMAHQSAMRVLVQVDSYIFHRGIHVKDDGTYSYSAVRP